VQVHYIPIPVQPFYRNLGFQLNKFPETERYYEEAFSLPLFPTLTSEDVYRVVDTLKNILDKNSA